MSVIAAALVAMTCLRAADWPQWRGPGASGVSLEANLPTTWSETENVVWKSVIPGRGHSSPILWGSRIFLTTCIEGEVIPGAKAPKHIFDGQEFVHPDSVGADRKQSLKVLCLDRKTGKILWEQTAYEGRVTDDRHRANTYASPTPVTDGQHLFAYFGSEGLFCYDLGGKLIWKVKAGDLLMAGMGPGTSPVLHEDRVLLQCDVEEGEGSFLAAYEKATGKEVWKVSRKHRASWATPLLVRHNQRDELVVAGAESVISYDPRTGKEVWRCQGVISHAIPSPVAGNGLVFLTAGSQEKRAFAVRLGGSGDLTDSPRIVWNYNKGTAYVPSPILLGDHLYLVTDRGLLTCLDAQTGKVLYEGARVPVPTKFSASPVAFGGKILLCSEDGDTFVIKAGATHEVLGTNSLGEGIFASPAISNGQLFIRTDRSLFCIALSAKAVKTE